MFRVYRTLGKPEELLEQLPDNLTTFSVPGEDLHKVVARINAIPYYLSSMRKGYYPVFIRIGNNYAAIASSCGFSDWDASYLFVEFE